MIGAQLTLSQPTADTNSRKDAEPVLVELCAALPPEEIEAGWRAGKR